MESRRDQQPNRGEAGLSLAQTVAAVGTLPAVIYGAAIEGIVGAAVGLILWGMSCALAAGSNRFRLRRRSGAVAPTAATTPSDPTSEAALFEQLRTAPCAVCGAPTLLDTCLACSEDWPHPTRRQWDDAARWEDEPEDPAR